jgi:uncharacterized protein YneF (UPF0154 family)
MEPKFGQEQSNVTAVAEKNSLTIEEIKDFSNTEIRELLKEEGMTVGVEIISDEDIEATKARAIVLAQDGDKVVSAEAFLMKGFYDRMESLKRLGDNPLQRYSDSAIKKIMYLQIGRRLSDEEVNVIRNTDKDIEKYLKEMSDGKFVAVDKTDRVVSRGETADDAMVRAREESGRA